VRARLDKAEALTLLAVLAALVIVIVPELGSQPWPFAPDRVEPRGLLDPLVRAAGREWDLGVPRGAALLAGLLVAGAAVGGGRARRWHPWVPIGVTAATVVLLLVPAALLSVGLRDATQPWQFTNDSTYQIELAGDLVLDGETPYGHDYEGSGLERFYGAAGFTGDPRRQVALTHFAYFPGTPLTAAAWQLVPEPFDDYRVFVLLATLAAGLFVLLLPGPLWARLAGAAVVAANPLAVRAAWFGTADMPSIALLVLAFALALRSRPAAAGAALAGAVLLKQFALVAIPFVLVLLLARGLPPRRLVRPVTAFVVVLAAGFAPFLLADAAAVWDDTVAYGTGTYRIIGYGLAGLLVGADVIERDGDYPFALLALGIWLPVTTWLLVGQLRTRAPWTAAAGFAISVFVLLWLGRVLQNSYFVWPLAGLVLAFVLAAGERVTRLGTSAYSRVEPTR
jgi:hypothetical protein